MKPAQSTLAGWTGPILALLLVMSLRLYADVIYLNNGNVMLVEKAWEEGDQVIYQTSKGIQSLPKSSVQSIAQEKPISPPTGQRWSIVLKKGEQSKADSSPAELSITPTTSGAPLSEETLARLRSNLKADPSDPIAKAELVEALNSVASLQVARGNLASAQNCLQEALELEKDNPALLYNLATIYFRLGDYQKCEGLLLTSLKYDRRNPWTYFLLGETYYKQEKIAQAISEWNEGLQLGPNEAITERLEQATRESGIHSKLGAMKSPHFILRYDKKTSDYQLGDQILTTLEKLYLRLSNELTSRAPETIAIILYPDQAYFDITRAPSWSGGVFDGKIRLPIRGLRTVTPELKATLVHELTHCFMIALSGRGSPAWFLEGVAQLQEGRSSAPDRKELAQLQRDKRLIPIEDLRGSFTRLPADMVDLAYAESLSAVEYLIARFGRSAIRDLLALMGQNYNFENAFNTALQHSAAEFEADWQRDLSR